MSKYHMINREKFADEMTTFIWHMTEPMLQCGFAQKTARYYMFSLLAKLKAALPEIRKLSIIGQLDWRIQEYEVNAAMTFDAVDTDMVCSAFADGAVYAGEFLRQCGYPQVERKRIAWAMWKALEAAPFHADQYTLKVVYAMLVKDDDAETIDEPLNIVPIRSKRKT